jgi:hypothetical protein
MSKNETFIDTQEKDLNLDNYFRELGSSIYLCKNFYSMNEKIVNNPNFYL